MQNGPDFDKLITPFVEIYQNIEHDLLVKIASHFKLYEEIGFKNSMEWYIKKIEELGGLNQEAVNIISKYSKIPKSKIIKMLKEAGLSTVDLNDIDKLNEIRSYKIDKNKLINSESFNNVIQNSYKELDQIFKLINTKAIEGSKEAYMDVLNQAYTEVSSGAFDYNTSIRKAINKMVDNGIKAVQYKQQDGTIRKYGIESVIRRDVLTAVVQSTNRASNTFINDLNAEYVEVSQHLGARVTNTYDYKDHSYWQGKVYKLDGSTDEYPNFQETCKEGDIQGIGGVNCRHIKWAFFPGISVPKAVNISKEENDKLYEQKQTQRAYERKIRLYQNKIDSFKEIGDVDNVEKYKNKLKDIDNEYNNYCDANNLKRNYAREQISTNSKVNRTKSDVMENKVFRDVTQEWIENATPNSHEVIFDDCFIDDDGIIHPIIGKEQLHPIPECSDEVEIANFIEKKFGGEIHLVPRISDISNTGIRTKTPDYIWKGSKWDLKTPGINGKFENTFERFIKKKDAKMQAKKFIINYKNFPTKTDEEIINVVLNTLKQPSRKWVETVIIIRDEKIIKIFSKT